MAAEVSLRRGSNPDYSAPVERSGLRILAIYKGSEVYVASDRPGYFRRATSQPIFERGSVASHPNETRKPSGE